jgi:cytochrome c
MSNANFETIPVPHDLPLSLPVPEWILVLLLVVSFLAHLIFVNLVVGGAILSLWCQIRGLKNPDYDKMSHQIAQWTTVNKSLAVVLGVAPLLTINVLYTVHFYAANALTGWAWMAVIPSVTIAFLLLYLHKYAWSFFASHKRWHIAVLSIAVLILLWVPLVFLTNVHLMQFPDQWPTVQGFLSAAMMPGVWGRYLHFIVASLVVAALWLSWQFGRSAFDFEGQFPSLKRADFRRWMYRLVFGLTMAQFLIGPLMFWTLPSHGINQNMILWIGLGILWILPAMYYVLKELRASDDQIGLHFRKIAILLGLTILCMLSGRQAYRMAALAEHRNLIAEKTAEFQKASKEARENKAAAPVALDPSQMGQQVFEANCAACHAENEKMVGPAIVDMAKTYSGDAESMKAWIRQPGHKNKAGPPMPPFPNLSPEELDALASYIQKFE